MKRIVMATTSTTLVAAALWMPLGAAAATSPTVTTVRQHTARADAALDRATALFAQGRDAEGTRQFVLSRKQLGIAASQAAQLRARANTSAKRQQAAAATRAVAAEQDQNVDQLVALLDDADGRVENLVAQAALADTRGREKAAAVLGALSSRVPPQAARGLAAALQALGRNRDDEARAATAALTSSEVSETAKATLAATVKANLAGQNTAAKRLAALIGSDRMPAAAKAGLQRAYDAVVAEQRAAADQLEQASANMPEAVRASVLATVQAARTNAQSLQNNRPQVPSGTTGGGTSTGTTAIGG